jgi:hypothetical protein
LMKKVVIISFSDFTQEPRVLRTIEALKGQFSIAVFSTGKEFEGIESIDISDLNNDYFFQARGNLLTKKIRSFINRIITREKPGSDKQFLAQYWNDGRSELLMKLKQQNASIYIGHGIYTIPLLAELSAQSKTIFNAHEYYPREFEENENWVKFSKPYFDFILRRYVKKVSLIFCVNETISKEYYKEYNVNAVVITNARDYVDISPSDIVNLANIKLVHHGAALKGRNLERTINIINFLPENYELHLILMPSDLNYYNTLVNTYRNQSRIYFHEAVKMSDIPKFINQFDIGVYILPPTNYNNLAALPNKFFDFIQGRLCLALSPNTEMKHIVQQYSIGVIAKGFESEDVANEIKKLSKEEIMYFKNNSHQCAKSLSAENNKIIIQNEIKSLLLN